MHAARRGIVTTVTTVVAMVVTVATTVVGTVVLTSSANATASSAAAGITAGSVTAPGPPTPSASEVGRWRVIADPTGGYTVTWRSPEPLPVGDDRPEFYVGRTPLGTPRPARDGRTLTLAVAGGPAPRVADLTVHLSGRVLDGTTPRPAAPRGLRAKASGPDLAPAPARTLAVDPGIPGDEQVVASDYRLPSRRITGMPAPIEMVGHVVRPADTSEDHPLVLFLHGRHAPCFGRPASPSARLWPCPRGTHPVPSHLGYDYVQRLLASQGYVTVSISADGINAQDFRLADGGGVARATLVRRHLDQWARWAAQGRFAVDMSRVVLVGHSRGGDGVDEASVETPLSAPYRIVGQVLVAPTNFGHKAAAYVPTVTMLPYCDGDVVDLQGQSYTDVARDLTADDTALRSSVMVMGANHNFFNTEWTPGLSEAPSVDDGGALPGSVCSRSNPTRLGPDAQRAVGRTYIAGAVALMAADDESVLPMFDGDTVAVPSARGADVRVHALGGGREVRRPGTDMTLGPSSPGATTQLCVGLAGARRTAACGRDIQQVRTPHWLPDSQLNRVLPSPRAFELRWSRRGQAGSLLLDRPLDLSSADGLDLRTAVDPELGGVRLRVRVYDGTGAGTELTPTTGRAVPALPGRNPFVFGKIWAQTLRVPVSAASGVDLEDVHRVELVGASAHGRVWLLDLAARHAGLAPVPVRRVPRISLGDLRVREGDGPGARVVRLPFTVRGAVRAPAEFVVVGQSVVDDAVLAPRRVTLRPGQTHGTVPLRLRPDRLDDVRVQRVLLAATPVHGVMTRRYLATLRILDDDPTPRVRVHRVASPAHEGRVARWRVTLSGPVGFDAFVLGTVVRGPGTLPRLRVGDVPRRWRRDRLFPVPPPDAPLYRGRPAVSALIPAGRTRATLSVPLRRDRVDEGREAVTLRVRLPHLARPVERTITVVD